ncbi:MAG: hypothetical protein ACTHQM_26460 [Thermoanaerobaculia bacterium]
MALAEIESLDIASQSRTEDLSSGLPHESALISGHGRPDFVGANEILPTVDVSRERGSWTEFGADGHKIVSGLIQPLGQTRKSVSIQLSHGDYKMVKLGLDAILYDEELIEIEPEDREAFKDRTIQRAGDALTLYKEKTVRDLVSNPANYAPNFKETIAATALRWTDYINSDPTVDVDRWCTALEVSHSVDRRSFTIGLPFDVYAKVKNHPKCQIISTTGFRQPATEAHLAALWNVEAVKVLSGKYQTQLDSKDTRTIQFFHLWTNVVVIYRRIEKPTIDAPLAGAIVRRKGFPIVREPHRDNDRDADIYPVVDKWGVMWRATENGNNRIFLADRVIA